ncbi:MAG: hypothetical protein H0U51_00430 [Propionibacteriales bacterium]|nr:hypothetical protein [Propionibacteriales bacterium]
MSAAAPTPAARPREVTVGGMQAVIGSAVALLMVFSVAQQLDSPTMQDALAQFGDDPRAASLNLTAEGVRSLMRYTLMALGVLSVTSLILGIFVLRRHRSSRIVLTVLGGFVAVASLPAGPSGWLVTAYVAVSLYLLWTKAARAWFAGSA